jgi:hypothetical protein
MLHVVLNLYMTTPEFERATPGRRQVRLST